MGSRTLHRRFGAEATEFEKGSAARSAGSTPQKPKAQAGRAGQRGLECVTTLRRRFLGSIENFLADMSQQTPVCVSFVSVFLQHTEKVHTLVRARLSVSLRIGTSPWPDIFSTAACATLSDALAFAVALQSHRQRQQEFDRQLATSSLLCRAKSW